MRTAGPERLYVVTRGRRDPGGPDLDLMTLVEAADAAAPPGAPSEYPRILRLCRRPVAVAEIAAHLGFPVSVVRVLLRDLLAAGLAVARPPAPGPAGTTDMETLEQVLVGLRNL
ncbi:DUF742 domain-containing protein [Actinomadura namibiensis]|uniref:DUF742 domain-containing protein n=1 Tax=Actinomadura namibiensis TaxID=182080 RepID=A0A7W3LN20_ACTNM|nr:DUF742 domain-containing protein [Actinomadura namibiensis]MBA8951077.1 hypothetical protein [Actinomadura namibiensis]